MNDASPLDAGITGVRLARLIAVLWLVPPLGPAGRIGQVSRR
jgi:hypothetical protein